MLVLEAIAALLGRFKKLPDVLAIGFLVLALGGVADLLVHVLDAPFLVIGGADLSEEIAHALVIAGSGMTVAGVALSLIGRRSARVVDQR